MSVTWSARSYVSMLSQALDWRARWLNAAAASSAAITDRDVLALSLIGQIFEVDTLFVDDDALAAALTATACAPDGPAIQSLSANSPSGGSRTCILATLPALESPEIARRIGEPSTLGILYNLGGGFALPQAGAPLRLQLLSSLNPCLWNSGLALALPSEPEAALGVAGRLSALLGDQSLDPLQLYDELCSLKQRARSGETLDTLERLRARSRGLERELIALRQFVQGHIERAALAARRSAAAATPHAVIDWSSAFAPTSEITRSAPVAQAALDDAEIRARQARTEAEFLRGQLRAHAIPREVDHHQLLAMSGFFDIAWYAESYDVEPEAAIRHYLSSGVALGCDPSPIFSTRGYLTANPDVAEHGFNPLLHYLMDGIYEGRAVNVEPSISEEVWRKGFGQID